MNYVCLIKSKETKEVIQIPLSCREYHANKLDYVRAVELGLRFSIILSTHGSL